MSEDVRFGACFITKKVVYTATVSIFSRAVDKSGFPEKSCSVDIDFDEQEKWAAFALKDRMNSLLDTEKA